MTGRGFSPKRKTNTPSNASHEKKRQLRDASKLSASYGVGIGSDELETQKEMKEGSGYAQIPQSHGVNVISITENRAREVCICLMNTRRISNLLVVTVADNHSYNESLSILKLLAPDEVLLHDGSRDHILTKKVCDLFNETYPQGSTGHDIAVTVMFISRQLFDQDRGAQLLEKVVVNHIDNDLIAKYTVLAGSFCLLRYIENCSGFNFAEHSVRLEYNANLSSRLVIDRHTARGLELISNIRTGSQQHSLFGIMNYTKTTVGARLLRATILSPSSDAGTINSRLDAVETLMRNPRRMEDLRTMFLCKFPDMDTTLSGLNIVPKTLTDLTVRASLDTLIYLKQALVLGPRLGESVARLIAEDLAIPSVSTVADSTSLLCAIKKALHQETLFTELVALLDSWLTMNESSEHTESASEKRHQECFALRSGKHAILDIARTIFLESVKDIYTLATSYGAEIGMKVEVMFSQKRGYFLHVPIEARDRLSDMYVQCVLGRRSISCTTVKVASLSDRAAESISTALHISHGLVQDLQTEVRQRIDGLLVFTDAIALLDMLCSFAFCITRAPLGSYSRPVVIDHSDCTATELSITKGRHVVVEAMQHLEYDLVPNDCTLSPKHPFCVVTGPNGSGKSTYIKQNAIIVIMAHMGCWVPAVSATIPVRTHVFGRLGTSDDMEHNMSTFLTEMHETAYILDHTQSPACPLVIIDELGRGTSVPDGCAIAVAIAEQLSRTKAYTLFVTHFPQVTQMASLYESITNVHLQGKPVERSSDAKVIPALQREQKEHELSPGPCDASGGYGIEMARRCGLPLEIIHEACKLLPHAADVFPALNITGGGGCSEGGSAATGEGAAAEGQRGEHRDKEESMLSKVLGALRQALVDAVTDAQSPCHIPQALRTLHINISPELHEDLSAVVDSTCISIPHTKTAKPLLQAPTSALPSSQLSLLDDITPTSGDPSGALGTSSQATLRLGQAADGRDQLSHTSSSEFTVSDISHE